jgi:hypothetical protein
MASKISAASYVGRVCLKGPHRAHARLDKGEQHMSAGCTRPFSSGLDQLFTLLTIDDTTINASIPYIMTQQSARDFL